MDQPTNQQTTQQAPSASKQPKKMLTAVNVIALIVVLGLIWVVYNSFVTVPPAQHITSSIAAASTSIQPTTQAPASPLGNYTNVSQVGDNYGNVTSNGNLSGSP